MQPTQELVDSIYREKVLRARRRSPEAKLMDGAELFEYACEIARSGIRAQFPNASDDEVKTELRRRLRIADILEGRS